MYLYLLSPSLCGMTVGISAVLWAVTIVYGDFARRMQKVWGRGGRSVSAVYSTVLIEDRRRVAAFSKLRPGSAVHAPTLIFRSSYTSRTYTQSEHCTYRQDANRC